MIMLEIRGNVNAKERYERQETTSWVKDMRRRGKREAVRQKKIMKYWLLGLRRRTRQAAKNQPKIWIFFMHDPLGQYICLTFLTVPKAPEQLRSASEQLKILCNIYTPALNFTF